MGLRLVSSCEELREMSIGEAKEMGRLQEGGHILALDGDCVVSNWDRSVTDAGRSLVGRAFKS